jgi:hypothetical protein
MCIHIDLTALPDGTYNLVPKSESEQHEAQVNLTEVAEGPNQRSEEPPTSFAQEGKPRCMIPIFNLCNCYFFLPVHLSSYELIRTLAA